MKHTRLFRRIKALFPLVLSLPGICQGQLPVSRLFTIFPSGGQVGATVEVEVSGQDLEDLRQLHFSDSNITAKLINSNKFSVVIASNMPPGVYDARLLGRYGISNPRAFAVGDLPEFVAPSTNKTAETAMPLSVNSTVNGRALSESFQFFKVSAKPGQRILIDCDADNIDSRMAPSLILLDSAGRELRRARDGELLDLIVKNDQEYIVKIHDFLFRGGPEYPYRLTISSGPRIDFVLPLSAAPGTSAKLTLFGRNLPGAATARIKLDGNSLEKLEVEAQVPETFIQQTSIAALLKPSAALVNGFDYRLATREGRSNPIFVSFAKAPTIIEKEPNNKPDQAQEISPPCEVSGQFFPEGDRDWIQFRAKRGETIWIEALSQRLGLPADPFFLIQRVTKNAKGEEQASDVQELYDSESPAGNEFRAGSLDPAYRLEVKEDAQYRIQIRDLFNSRADPRRVYRLSLRKESPQVTLVAIPQPGGPPKADAKDAAIQVPFLRRGETIPLKVVALRREGFKGRIDIAAEGLPPAITATTGRIEDSTNSTVLFLTASESAPGWSGSFNVVGRASTNVVATARMVTTVWNTTDVGIDPLETRFTRDLTLAVSESELAPVVIVPSEEKSWESCVGGKLNLTYRIARNGDFASALKLKAMGASGLNSMKEVDVDAKATNAVVQLDLAKVPPGEYNLVFQSPAQGKYLFKPIKPTAEKSKNAEKPKDATVFAYSRPVRLTVAGGPVIFGDTGTTNAVRAGDRLELPIGIKRLFGFDDAVELVLTGPDTLKGMKPAKISIPKEKQEIRLELETPANATPGDYEFKLQAELKFNNQPLKVDRKVPIRIAASKSP